MKFLFLLLVGFVGPTDSNWPGFLGPVSSKLQESQVPLEWSAESHIAWKANLSGYGQSSPVVWQDQVYVTTIEGAKKETLKISAYSLESGKQLWQYQSDTKNQGENADYFSRAAPTPIVDESGVIAFFEGGDLIAVDHAGNKRWQRDLVAEYGPIASRHGLSSSLVQHDTHAIVWVERENEPYLLAVSKSDGKNAWKTDRVGGVAWSSPVLLPLEDGSVQLVVSASGAAGGPRGGPGGAGGAKPASGTLTGYDPVTGKQLWQIGELFGNSAPTPAVVGPGKLLVGASAGREGGPTTEAIRTNGLVQVKKEGDAWKVDYVWRSKKATCGFCSPAFHNGLAYFVDRRGTVFCLNAETGEEVYTDRLGDSVWATPLGIGSRVYFVGEQGTTVVAAAGAEFEKLATNELWTAEPPPENANPQMMPARARQYAIVAVPGSILIRRGDTLFCIR